MSIKEKLKLYPLVPIAVCLIIGIQLGENTYFSYYLLYTLMLAIVTLCILFNKIRNLAVVLSMGIYLFFILFGVYITKRQNENINFKEKNYYEIFNAIVKTESIDKEDGCLVQVEVVNGRMEGKTIRLHLIYNKEDYEHLDLLGECIAVRAKIRKPTKLKNTNFDYPQYLKSHGIGAVATAYENNWYVIEKHNYSLSPIENMKIYFMKKRRVMVKSLRSLGMENQDFAVTAAMSLGDKSEISRTTSNIYSLAGTSHVLALSGLHLSIVFGIFSLFGGRWKKSVIMVVISVVAMWIYVFLAGLPVSMVRSAIMLSVSILIGLAGRDGITLNTLSFSAIIILLVNPFAIYDVGFQLSFSAVAYLGAFAGGLCEIIPQKILYRHRFLKWCWQLSVSSIVAQLGTTPLVAYHFGRIPLFFLPANFIAIPAATAILYLSVAFFIFLWLPISTVAIGNLLSIVSSVLNDSMTFIAQFKWSSLTIENMNIVQVVCFYIISIALLLILQRIQLFSSSRGRHLRV